MINDKDITEYLKFIKNKSQEYTNFVLKVIASRVVSTRTQKRLKSSSSDFIFNDRKHLLSIESELDSIKSEISNYLTQLTFDVVKNVYADASSFYATPTQLELNGAILLIGQSHKSKLENMVNDILDNSVILMRDLTSQTLKLYSIEEAYNSVIGEALYYYDLPDDDFFVNMKRTMTQLATSGLRNKLERNNFSSSIDTMIDTVVGTGIKDLAEEVSMKTGEQFGADAIMLSAHEMPAPDHEPVQGRIFTLSEYSKMQMGADTEDIYGNKYEGFPRAIGTWNCRHYPINIKLDKVESVYSGKFLDEIIERNHKGITLPNGKHMTLYECTQKINQYERQIEIYKRNIFVAKIVKDNKTEKEFVAKLAQTKSQYQAFCKYTGLPSKNI